LKQVALANKIEKMRDNKREAVSYDYLPNGRNGIMGLGKSLRYQRFADILEKKNCKKPW
jgi:hypothetical protein